MKREKESEREEEQEWRKHETEVKEREKITERGGNIVRKGKERFVKCDGKRKK